MGRHLLWAVIGFSFGIWVCSLVHLAWPVIGFIGLLGVLFLGARASTKYGAYMAASILILAAFLGMVRTALVPDALPTPFAPLLGTAVSLEGTIVSDPDIRETGQRITVAVSYGNGQTRILAVAPLYPELRYGAHVRVQGVLELPQPFATDGGRTFAYDTFLRKDGIYAMVPHVSIDVLAPPSGFLTRVQGALFAGKHAFIGALERALTEPYAGLATGLIAGGKQGLGKELLDMFTIAGLLPIVVLSGYNVMIVAQFILRALAFLPKRFAFMLAALGIALFVLSAGGGSSAVRAGLMAGLALFARASGRTYDALRALLVVFALMLLLNPLLLVYDPGFQFSFAATLGLIIGSPLLAVRLAWIANAFMREIVATTLAAQIAVLPLLLYQTGNLSLVAIPANVLVLPVVPLAMLFSGIAGAASLVFPAIAAIAGLPAFAFLYYIIGVARITADLPLAHLIIPAFPFWIVIFAYTLLALLVRHLKETLPAPKEAGRVSLPLPSSITAL